MVAGEQRLVAAHAEDEALLAVAVLELGLVFELHRCARRIEVDAPAAPVGVLDPAELALDRAEEARHGLIGRRLLEVVGSLGIEIWSNCCAAICWRKCAT